MLEAYIYRNKYLHRGRGRGGRGWGKVLFGARQLCSVWDRETAMNGVGPGYIGTGVGLGYIGKCAKLFRAKLVVGGFQDFQLFINNT